MAIRQGNVNNMALHVIGLYGSGDKMSFVLQDWDWQRWLGLAKVAISCHMAWTFFVSGNVRSGKETCLVWVLSRLASVLLFKSDVVCTPIGMNAGFQTCLGVVKSRSVRHGVLVERG